MRTRSIIHTLGTHVGKLKSMIRERYGRLPGRLEEEEEVSRALSKAIIHTLSLFAFKEIRTHPPEQAGRPKVEHSVPASNGFARSKVQEN